MSVVKFFPAEDQPRLIAAMNREKREYLSAKVVKDHGKGIVDLVVNVPDASNELVEKVSSKKDASPRYEEDASPRYEDLD